MKICKNLDFLKGLKNYKVQPRYDVSKCYECSAPAEIWITDKIQIRYWRCAECLDTGVLNDLRETDIIVTKNKTIIARLALEL